MSAVHQPLDLDTRIRYAAFEQLRSLRDQRGVVTREEMSAGFEFEGERIPFASPAAGIWRPQQLSEVSGAALSILTQPHIVGRIPAYDDEIAPDADRLHYRYEGDDPQRWTNRAVRRAYELRKALIYFSGIRPGLYDPIFPCYVIADHPESLTFDISFDFPDAKLIFTAEELRISEDRRRYGTAVVVTRLHQRRFREQVVAAYGERCAVCTLHHPELLDAAHILEDKHERGLPEVPNGLALCKIHHGAFDTDILGISPECRVTIRQDVLRERNGPMLTHGLQAMDGHPIVIPEQRALQPNRAYLEERYRRFLAA